MFKVLTTLFYFCFMTIVITDSLGKIPITSRSMTTIYHMLPNLAYSFIGSYIFYYFNMHAPNKKVRKESLRIAGETLARTKSNIAILNLIFPLSKPLSLKELISCNDISFTCSINTDKQITFWGEIDFDSLDIDDQKYEEITNVVINENQKGIHAVTIGTPKAIIVAFLKGTALQIEEILTLCQGLDIAEQLPFHVMLNAIPATIKNDTYFNLIKNAEKYDAEELAFATLDVLHRIIQLDKFEYTPNLIIKLSNYLAKYGVDTARNECENLIKTLMEKQQKSPA